MQTYHFDVQVSTSDQSLRQPTPIDTNDRGAIALGQLKSLWSKWLPGRPRLFNYLKSAKEEGKTDAQETLKVSYAGVETDEERDLEAPKPVETVLYLAYGSNLCAETFLGRRGIRPISQINVVVPSLKLTFDLPGFPYSEPCFANTARRDPNNPTNTGTSSITSEKTPLLSSPSNAQGYHKDRWHKGLVGVLYELTPSDYAHVIETEGGGASYHDILVECHPLLASSPDIVPEYPSTPPVLAHTLFAPAVSADDPNRKKGGRLTRPDPAYAQASARYLKLITDGAAEHSLPTEYRAYLADLRPYTLTSQRQRLGQFIFVSLWLPVISFVFGVQGLFADENGRNPEWLVQLTSAIFVAVWGSYDHFFRDLFGDGERTRKDEKNDDQNVPGRNYLNVHGGLSGLSEKGM